MATSRPSKANKPALLPANVPGIVRELHRLAAGRDGAAGGAAKPRDGGGRMPVMRSR